MFSVTDVYILSDNIITPLGFTTSENASEMLSGKTGIRLREDELISPQPFFASLVDSELLKERFSQTADPRKYTRFEQLAICSVAEALSRADVETSNPRSLFILSATKGNIDLLKAINRNGLNDDRIYLWNTARLVSRYFNFSAEPVVVSNACISGVQAIITGVRLIRSGLFDDVVINGTDIITEFVFAGFNSFKSLSVSPCRPFDKSRDGLSLGEGSGTIVLSRRPHASEKGGAIVAGEGFSGNDANHISGPSRTGEGLFQVIEQILKNQSSGIDFISAHGTATTFNDEMESIALTRAGLYDVPVNSFKGYWGHTLGASGIIESIMSIYSIREKILFKTEGFSESDLKHPIRIIEKVMKKDIKNCLKLASGFGGCNAAIIFREQ